jgi:hypothetical protein
VSAQDTSSRKLDVFNQVYAKIKNDYVDHLDGRRDGRGQFAVCWSRLTLFGIPQREGMSAFYKDFSVEKTPGIGVILTKANGYPTILEAIPGGSAQGRTKDLCTRSKLSMESRLGK